jgi:hypothetical protein
MQTTQHSNIRCPAYLHPPACSSRAAVEVIQQHTGFLVITTPKGRTASIKPTDFDATSECTWPFGGGVA